MKLLFAIGEGEKHHINPRHIVRLEFEDMGNRKTGWFVYMSDGKKILLPREDYLTLINGIED